MGKYTVEQHRITHRGREFHFVSYEGQPANEKRKQPAVEPAWFLMNSGKRWQVMPHQPGQDDAELERKFTEWLETNVFV
jgi:hypothetical protein